MERLTRVGASFVSVTQNFSTADAMGRLTMNMLQHGLPRHHPMSKPGKPLAWTKDSVARLICNPMYAGFITNGEERYPGEHTALVDSETWQASQQLVEERTRTQKLHIANPEYLLSGLLRCGQCQGAMCPSSTSKGKTVHRYHRCATRDKQGRAACTAAPMAAAAIEKYVANRIEEVVQTQDFVSDTYGAFTQLVQERMALLRSQQQAMAARIGDVSARTGKLVDEWVNAESDVRDLLSQRISAGRAEVSQLEAGLAEAKRQHLALDGKCVDIEWVTRALGNFNTVWQAMTAANRGRLLRALIDRVFVDEATGKVDIHLDHLDEAALQFPLAESA
jgi:hypothetical protein